MKYSGHGKLLCEFSKLSKLNTFNLLGYQSNTGASILVYTFRPERTGFNMYAEYTRPQLTFLALVPWIEGQIDRQRERQILDRPTGPCIDKYLHPPCNVC